VREGAGASAGEAVAVELERDEAPRRVEIPYDPADALKAAPDAGKKFKGLSYTHQKEYASWIHRGKARRHEAEPSREDDLAAPGRREASLSSTAVEAWAQRSFLEERR
jgi:bacteriocin resistance YdeI/OmpD-like protein